jgi:hypothetical protein
MTLRALAMTACLLLTGIPDSSADASAVEAARAFYKQPRANQLQSFRQHGLEEQLGLFFFGNQRRHPPAIYLARCFALGGEPAIETLRSRLTSELDDLTVRDISTLLDAFATIGSYDVAKDAALMEALKMRISSMHDQGWRDTAEKSLHRIERLSGSKSVGAPECG